MRTLAWLVGQGHYKPGCTDEVPNLHNYYCLCVV
jgi:hypothetical protein